MDIVSVPIRGLFNLTQTDSELYDINGNYVSVPIRGLFNLTPNMIDIIKFVF